ncbi:MAG: DUF72 domain-containing protein [Acidobacteriota bacterium]
MERDRYFRELSYLELSLLFAGPVKPSVLARWAEVAPPGALGLVAPFPLTHRKPPSGAKLWPHDATTGDFRGGATASESLGALRAAVDQLHAGCVVFRSPESFSPSAANRDALHRFFGELATADALGVPRVWLPGGLWEVRAAAKLAGELGLTAAFDPLVREPGEPLEIYFELEVEALYLRIEGTRTGTIRAERMDDLAALVEHYAGIPTTIAFATAERWQDARNFKKLLGERPE